MMFGQCLNGQRRRGPRRYTSVERADSGEYTTTNRVSVSESIQDMGYGLYAELSAQTILVILKKSLTAIAHVRPWMTPGRLMARVLTPRCRAQIPYSTASTLINCLTATRSLQVVDIWI